MTPVCRRCVFWLCAFCAPLFAADPLVLQVDFGRPQGTIRPLHGINKGPLGPGGLLDLTAEQRALGIPLTRLHDCYWPNPYVVDIHAVFPDFTADPSHPQSYDFRLTDEYIAAVRATGAQIVYRLGESIEHTTVKRYAHPPADRAKWAAICLGIIRHYNEGWAGGFHHGIRYWEIWNEPENRPAMWSGSDEDYFELYRVASRTIKRAYPNLSVGGPAVGASGQFVPGNFQPTAFVQNFLQRCKDDSLPLDFFSWHCYTKDPHEIFLRACAIRRLLDDSGFPKTESHLNEWNYLPDNSWAPLSRQAVAVDRQRAFAEIAGLPGAAFIASTLIELQEAPLDAANLFHGEAGAFGLFNEFGVPQKNYFVLRAFRALVETPRRVQTQGGVPGQLALGAGLAPEGDQATVLLSNFRNSHTDFRIELSHLPWTEETVAEIRWVDGIHDPDVARTETIASDRSSLSIHLPDPGVAAVRLRPLRAQAAHDKVRESRP